MPYGLRGLLGARLTLRTGTKDAHSGVTGGAARNPLAELMEVAHACVDALGLPYVDVWFWFLRGYEVATGGLLPSEWYQLSADEVRTASDSINPDQPITFTL